ncbi:RMD1 family protein [Aquimarina sediminis]|uniref:RMD1 family protein n=1 Tax=Aquimarina sediminis TaxID=2070536 RepID=UPI0013E8CA08|nr:RMD1 family protein [Aquimarina sediminis]
MKKNTFALQISESIDISACKNHFKQTLLFSNRDELFFDFENQKYAYIFKYGILCVFNFASNELDQLRQQLFKFTTHAKLIDSSLTQSIDIIIDAESFRIDFESVHLIDNNIEKIRLVMYNVSQSVLLDYYTGIAEQLIEDTAQYTNFIEAKGTRLYTDDKKHKHFVEKVLNSKNKISENLYIFDSPSAVSDDETLTKLNTELKKKFEVNDKHKTISQKLNIVKENLEFFKHIMVHRKSSKLIWIIIVIVILVLFILKFIK